MCLNYKEIRVLPFENFIFSAFVGYTIMKDDSDIDKSLTAIGKELEKDLNNWEAWAAKADLLLSMGYLKQRLDAVISRCL